MAANESADRREPKGHLDATHLEGDVALLCRLMADGFEVDGEAMEIEGRCWIVYGHSAYDGGVVMAEYADAQEAIAVLRAVPRHPPGPSSSTSDELVRRRPPTSGPFDA